jgi:hypothetical protein
VKDCDELRDLIDAMVEESISDTQMARLTALLRDDPEAQSFYLRYLDLDANLRLEMRGGVRPESASPRRRAPVFRLASAAALLLAGLAAFWGWRSRPAAAVLVHSHQAVWGGAPPADALQNGPFRLEKGVVQIHFSGGATVTVEGPTEFEVAGPLRLVLRSGQVVCRADPGAKGFTVGTSKGDFIDLGTEFGVRADQADRTEVQVYEGEVIASLKDSDVKRHLLGGEALDVGAVAREIPFQPYRFARTIPGPKDPRGRGMHPYNRAHFDEIHLVPAPLAVAIDGDLSEWDLSGRVATACEPPYQAYTLEAAMMFDARGVYLGGHVRDPHPMRSQVSPDLPGDRTGIGGSVAFRISTDRRMGWPLRGRHADIRGNDPERPEDVNDKLAFLTLWYYEPERKPCLHLRYGMDLHERTVNPAGFRGAFRKDADDQGYTFEYFVPWEILHAADDPPQGGDVLGAMCLAHWSDEHGQSWQGQLIDVANTDVRGWNFYNAATWGKAIYHSSGRFPQGTVHPVPNPRPHADE